MYGGHIFYQERHITCPLSVARVICATTVKDPVVAHDAPAEMVDK